ncbi:pentapeptide repeat-containing protein [Haloarcula mannanilytica]|uniref:pentapeptide repeat-containing protein n=1 Tax=Haloarcula mannanilytica TaxID=2509225 RepID=UPI001359CEEC|nr:pentapeptide repeat-containing protein [Haloarcula mannanilytica]
MATFEKFTGSDETVDADTVAQLPIGQAIEDTDNELDITRSEVLETWRSHNQDRIPDKCPHDCYTTDAEYCLFHMDPEAHPKQDITTNEISKQVAETISKQGEQTKCFVGSRFSQLDLSNKTLQAPDNHPIDFRFSTFQQETSFSETVFEQNVKFKGAKFETVGDNSSQSKSEYNAHYVDFKGDFDFMRAEFRSEADFKFCTFLGDVRFNSAEFAAAAMFNYSRFEGRSDFMASTFTGKADFSKCRFDEVAYLNGTYDTAGIFNYTVFAGDVVLYRTIFSGKAEFFATKFGGEFDSGYAKFRGEARFNEAEFTDDTSFENSVFSDEIYLKNVSTESLINLTHSRIAGGEIVLPKGIDTPIFDFSFATLGAVSFDAPVEIVDELFEYVIFNRTKFKEFNFNEHQENLKPSWRIHTTVGDSPGSLLERRPRDREMLNALESTYNRAKVGAKDVGHNKAASEFFFKQMSTRRRQYLARFWNTPDWRKKGVLLARWASNGTIGLITGYGERPSYVIGTSMLVIPLFSVVYWALPSDPPTSGKFGLEYLIFSIQSFVTLILGSAPADSSVAFQFVSAIEAFIGAFLIALLVFTLTRSIHR